MIDTGRVGYSITMLTGDYKSPYEVDGWGDIAKSPVAIPTKVGRGVFEISTIRPGMVVSKASHAIASRESREFLEIARNDVRLSEPAITFQSLVKGRLVHTDEGLKQTEYYDTDTTLVQWGDHLSFRREHEVGAENELYTLILTKQVLEKLLGERLAKKLLNELRLGGDPTMSALKPPPLAMSALNYSVNSSVSEEFQKIYSSAKILEYLSLIADFILGPSEARISPRRNRIAHMLRDELYSLKGTPPRLDSLADKYGVSVRTLSDYFRKEFDEPISSFSKRLRMGYAQELIIQTELPLKVIAAKVGYAHVSNFAYAFKEIHGYAPGRLRA